MNMRKYSFFRLDGACNIADRRDMVNEFQKPTSKTFVFLLSTRAGIYLFKFKAGSEWLWLRQIRSFSMIMTGTQQWTLRPLTERTELVKAEMWMCTNWWQRGQSKKELWSGPNRRKWCNRQCTKELHLTFSRKIWFCNWWWTNSKRTVTMRRKRTERSERKGSQVGIGKTWVKIASRKVSRIRKTKWWEDCKANRKSKW